MLSEAEFDIGRSGETDPGKQFRGHKFRIFVRENFLISGTWGCWVLPRDAVSARAHISIIQIGICMGTIPLIRIMGSGSGCRVVEKDAIV